MFHLQDFKVYSKEDEDKLNAFCKEHNIQRNNDEFYFELNNVQYRISRYSIVSSSTQSRGLKNPNRFKFQKPTIYFKAKRNMVRLIYNSLVAGYSEEEIKNELVRRNAKKSKPTPPVSKPERVIQSTPSVNTGSDLINDLLKRR